MTAENTHPQKLGIEIKTLTLAGKKLTQATFRQLEIEDLITPELRQKGDPLGRVNYFPPPCNGKNVASHLHIVWQKGDELRRACVDEESPSEESIGPSLAELRSAAKGLFAAEIYVKPEEHYRAKRRTYGEWEIVREFNDVPLLLEHVHLSLKGPWITLVNAAQRSTYSDTQESIVAVAAARKEAQREYGSPILAVDQAAQCYKEACARLNSFLAGYRKLAESFKTLPQLFV